MKAILDEFRREKEYQALISLIRSERERRNPRPARMTGLCDGARSVFIASLIEDLEKPLLFIVPDEKDARRARELLEDMGLRPAVFPARDFVFYSISSSRDGEHERIGALSAVVSKTCDVVITTPEAALQYTVPAERLKGASVTVDIHSPCDMDALTEILQRGGYSRTELTEGQGQYSVRGGIIDVFPPGTDNPVRIEFFGDEIDSMSFFDVITQRRTDEIDTVCITPAREVVADGDARVKISDEIRRGISRARDGKTKERLAGELETVLSGRDLLFIDRFISCIYPEKECLLDYFDARCPVILHDFNACSDRVKAYEWHTRETVVSLLEEGVIASKYAEYGRNPSSFAAFVGSHAGVIVDSFVTSAGDIRFSGMFSISSRQTVSYAENFGLLCDDLVSFGRGGNSVVILCENPVLVKNISGILNDRGITAHKIDLTNDGIVRKRVSIATGAAIQGFELPDLDFIVLSTCLSAGNYSGGAVRARKKRLGKKESAREKILSYADLKVGDYVVHESQGIGRYMGIENISSDGVVSDYIKLQYDGTDVLYVPCGQLDTIAKYIGPGADSGTVRLSSLGSAAWTRSKQRIKAAARDMAEELIRLYAERERLPGFAFPKDDEMQRDFEASFPYDETEGQITAIRQVKGDMQSPHPMDRLLCGDVGFGKTEVALRAAFKAVDAGKQVAVLVPTTILALQHYQTFSARLRGFPVSVEMLSRFRTKQQQEETVRRIRRGETDIVVGTHRIISDDVKFRDLGLVIIDEEQRFGVAAKEKLRRLSSGVDTLTLTATPIPRTLSMAMSGIRDMSVLEEAPGDRLPVQTYVMEYDELIIAEAIRRELRRGGQVFYLYNRVETIDDCAARVHEMVPDARIAVGHGRMDRDDLSSVWKDMLDGQIDVLVSTTIIESGIDIPNANTLIIENADRYGLSQLHQIRGRVGRSSRRAYAYFTFRKGQVLNEDAAKRLEAIREYTEFGSGFKIALRDLEIRGAGNLLGAEQSGHIESVGYDMYMKLLSEAVIEAKGVVKEKKPECAIEMDVSAFIPESYIKSNSQRIDVYRKISLVENVDDTVDIIDELLDRYGELPKTVATLLDVSLLRAVASSCGIEKIQRKGANAVIFPLKFDVKPWLVMTSRHKGEILISVDRKPYVTLRIKKITDTLDKTLDFVREYKSVLDGMSSEEGGNV